MKPLQEVRSDLRELVPVGIADAIKALKDLLPKGSEKYQQVLAFEGRLNETNKNRLFGVISDEQLQLEYNRLRKGILDLINEIDQEDFAQPPASTTPGRKIKYGNILYRIPSTMPLGKEVKCIVRIALNKEIIVQNIDFDEHVQLREARVSDIMQVELLDPAEFPAFKIRSISTPEQFIEENEFTEWLFYILPQRAGVFPLLLKVSVIELILGQERKREIVLEEQVQIVTARAVENEPEIFKPAGYTLSFSAEESGQPNEPERARPSELGMAALRRIAFLLAGLLAFTSIGWGVAPHEMEWILTRYWQNNERAYRDYIEQFPESRHREKAFWRKAEVSGRPEALAEYLAEYPDGLEGDNAIIELQKREEKVWAIVQQFPERISPLQYLKWFPEGKYAEAAKKLLKKEEGLEQKEEMLQDTVSSEGTGAEEKTIPELPGSKPEASKDKPELQNPVKSKDKKGLVESRKTPEAYQQETVLPELQPQAPPAPPAPSRTTGSVNLGGKTYRTIQANGLVWMAENLNYDNGNGSWCYAKDPKNCAIYGRLYTWEAAKKACEGLGWRLPADAEWSVMRDLHGGPSGAFHGLMVGGESGFSALLGGYKYTVGGFGYIGDTGSYWSGTEADANNAWYYSFRRNNMKLYRASDYKVLGLSCRCVRDAPSQSID